MPDILVSTTRRIPNIDLSLDFSDVGQANLVFSNQGPLLSKNTFKPRVSALHEQKQLSERQKKKAKRALSAAVVRQKKPKESFHDVMARLAQMKEQKDIQRQKFADISGLDENGNKKGIMKELDLKSKDLDD